MNKARNTLPGKYTLGSSLAAFFELLRKVFEQGIIRSGQVVVRSGKGLSSQAGSRNIWSSHARYAKAGLFQKVQSGHFTSGHVREGKVKSFEPGR